MDDLDELPTWAARAHVPGTNLPLEAEPPKTPRRRPLRALLLVLLGLLALVAVAGLGYVAATRIGTDSTETANGDDATDSEADSAAADAEGDGSTAAASTDEAGADLAADGAAGDGNAGDVAADATAAGSSADDDAAEDATTGDAEDESVTALRGTEVVDNSDGNIRYAVLKGGQLFLRGRVHSEEYSLAVEEVATAVMGPGNVVNEYEVDPSTPDVVDSPIYVDDVVLFEFNSIEVAPPFFPILDLGTALMKQNPSVTMTVVSRTDSVGSEAVNREVAELRGQAVVNYWARQGVDPTRITVVAAGEEEASDDADDAALDRRAEFVIENLFG
jgi:outer membrane protein OmpA-like peptidoglycan-associated protein